MQHAVQISFFQLIAVIKDYQLSDQPLLLILPVMKAEKNKRKGQLNADVSSKKDKTYVYPIRDWKEYLGESLLIVFSVLLA
jgi:hypothetical protein